MHAVRQDSWRLHHIKADGTFCTFLLREVGQDALGIHLVVPDRVLSLAELLDEILDVDRTISARCFRCYAFVWRED